MPDDARADAAEPDAIEADATATGAPEHPAPRDDVAPGGHGARADRDAGGRGGGRAGRVVLAAALLAAVVAGVLAVLQAQRASDLQADLDDRDAVAATAAEFGDAYFTYDFDDPDGSGDRVLALATPDFAEDFSSTRAPGVEELFANLRTTTTAETTEVFVSDVTGDTARAIVAVDVEAVSAASGAQRLTDVTFVVDLVHLDGEWLVDQVNPAPQPNLEGDGVEATTTTTAPPAATTTTAP